MLTRGAHVRRAGYRRGRPAAVWLAAVCAAAVLGIVGVAVAVTVGMPTTAGFSPQVATGGDPTASDPDARDHDQARDPDARDQDRARDRDLDRADRWPPSRGHRRGARPVPSPAASQPEPPASQPEPPGSQPPGGWPGFADTGVPAGVTLDDYTGPLTITQPGTVIDGALIDGCLEVQAENVLITRSKITCSGTLLWIGSGSVTIEDTELDGQGIAQTTGGKNTNYTLRRVNIHNINEGPRLEGDNLVEDSWIHDLVRTDPGDHQDVLQTTGGSGVVIRHNTLVAYNPDQYEYHNAAFMIGSEFSPLRDLLVEDNLMSGGSCTVNIRTDSDAGDVRFRNNTFEDVSRYDCPVIGHETDGISWQPTNVWRDTGEAVARR